MLLLIISILLSAGIMIFGLLNGRSCFGSYDRTSAGIRELSKVLETCVEGESFKEVLVGWVKVEDTTTRAIARDLRRLFQREPLQLQNRTGWMVDVDELCDAKRHFGEHPGNPKAEAMPGLLTGTGILLTFLGLTIGIYGLDPTDSEQLTSGVGQLLSGMSLAFLSSIAGISTALWWTWRNKVTHTRFDAAFSQLSNTLHEKSFLLIPEELSYQLLIFQSAQTQALNHLPRGIQTAFAATLSEQLAPFKEHLGGSGKNNMDQVLGQLRADIKQLSMMTSESNELNRKICKTLELIAKQGSGGGQGSSSEVAQAFSANPEQVAASIGQINQSQAVAVQQIRETAEQLKKLVHAARVATRDIAVVHKEVREHLERLDQHWAAYQGQLDAMVRGIGQSMDAFNDKLGQSLGDVHSQFDGLLAESLQHFAGALQNMQETVESSLLSSKSDTPKAKRSLLGKSK